jgi:hypothetical protein
MAELRTVEFFGESFGLNPDPSQFALLEFAEAAADGQDGDTAQGLASVLRLVKECVVESDVVEDGEVVAHGRGHFVASCRKNRATVETLMPVIQEAFSVSTERPTGRPADSSVGPASIAPKSEPRRDDSTSLFPGRPDLQLMVDGQREAERVAV